MKLAVQQIILVYVTEGYVMALDAHHLNVRVSKFSIDR